MVAIQQQRFEFLFLGLSLPDVSPFDVFEDYAEARKEEGAEKRVVAMTLNTARDEINRANELGFAAVMYEPFSHEEVRQIVKLIGTRRERPRRMRHLTNHGNACVLECPARKSSRFPGFVNDLDNMVEEIECMAEEGLDRLAVRIGEGFLSQPEVAKKFVKVLEKARTKLGSIRLVVESRETRDVLRQYSEIASLPKDLSLEYSLNSMK
jgi:DNA-binding response OmpR family regulator